jgi:hypothetical protein
VRFPARSGNFVRNFGPKPHKPASSRVKTHRIATWRGLPATSGARWQFGASVVVRWQIRAEFGPEIAQTCHLAGKDAQDCHVEGVTGDIGGRGGSFVRTPRPRWQFGASVVVRWQSCAEICSETAQICHFAVKDAQDCHVERVTGDIEGPDGSFVRLPGARWQSGAVLGARWQIRAEFGPEIARNCHLAGRDARDCHLEEVTADLRDVRAPAMWRLPDWVASTPC